MNGKFTAHEIVINHGINVIGSCQQYSASFSYESQSDLVNKMFDPNLVIWIAHKFKNHIKCRCIDSAVSYKSIAVIINHCDFINEMKRWIIIHQPSPKILSPIPTEYFWLWKLTILYIDVSLNCLSFATHFDYEAFRLRILNGIIEFYRHGVKMSWTFTSRQATIEFDTIDSH